MPKVAKHDGEQEGKGNDGVGGGVHFSVGGDSVGVVQRLKGGGELVGVVISGRVFGRVHSVQDGRHRAATALLNKSQSYAVTGQNRTFGRIYYRSTSQSQLNIFQIQDGHPTLGNQTLLSHVQIEEIERVVDRLDFAHFDKPVLDIFGGRHQNTVPMVLGLAQNLKRSRIKSMQMHLLAPSRLRCSNLQCESSRPSPSPYDRPALPDRDTAWL